MTYSLEFRKKVLEIRKKESLSIREVAKRFRISSRTIVGWLQRLNPKLRRHKPAVRLDMEALKKDIQDYPDAYQYERAARLGVTATGIWHALRRLNVTYKKTLIHPKATAEKRSAFCQEIERLKAQGRPLIYVDESGFAHDMPHALKGQRCYGKQDWGAKGRTNVIGALLAGTLLTVCLFQSTINTAIFDQWMIQDLIPKLPAQSVVIMDNAAFHKGKRMNQALTQAGHTLLYLPPYSPDLNPIEHKWAQAKALRRATGHNIQALFQIDNL